MSSGAKDPHQKSIPDHVTDALTAEDCDYVLRLQLVYKDDYATFIHSLLHYKFQFLCFLLFLIFVFLCRNLLAQKGFQTAPK